MERKTACLMMLFSVVFIIVTGMAASGIYGLIDYYGSKSEPQSTVPTLEDNFPQNSSIGLDRHVQTIAIPSSAPYVPKRTFPYLSPRQPDPNYENSINTGFCMLQMADTVPVPSEYTSLQDLENGGWEEHSESDDNTRAALYRSLSDVFEANHWDPDNFQEFSWSYPQPWIRDIPRPYYTAGYTVWISATDGTIITVLSKPPKEPVDDPDRPPPGRTPPTLRRWSDFAYVCWLEACNIDMGDAHSLRYIVHYDISDRQTQYVAGRALVLNTQRASYSPPDYPGLEGTVDYDPTWFVHALVGTPAGRGVALLAGASLAEIGWKTVEGAAVFASSDADEAKTCVAFRLGDAQDFDLPARV